MLNWRLENCAIGVCRLNEEPEFIKVLHEEVQARGLVLKDVKACAWNIYSRLLAPWCDRDEAIVISEMDFTAEEYAALITFMKVQRKWGYGLSWEEVSGKDCEGNVEGL